MCWPVIPPNKSIIIPLVWLSPFSDIISLNDMPNKPLMPPTESSPPSKLPRFIPPSSDIGLNPCCGCCWTFGCWLLLGTTCDTTNPMFTTGFCWLVFVCVLDDKLAGWVAFEFALPSCWGCLWFCNWFKQLMATLLTEFSDWKMGIKFYRLDVLPFSAEFNSLFSCIMDRVLWWWTRLKYLIIPSGVRISCSVVTLSNGKLSAFKLLFNCPIYAYDILEGLSFYDPGCWLCWCANCVLDCWGCGYCCCCGGCGILIPKLPRSPPNWLLRGLFMLPNAIVIWGGGWVLFPGCCPLTWPPNIEFIIPIISPNGLIWGGGGTVLDEGCGFCPFWADWGSGWSLAGAERAIKCTVKPD